MHNGNRPPRRARTITEQHRKQIQHFMRNAPSIGATATTATTTSSATTGSPITASSSAFAASATFITGSDKSSGRRHGRDSSPLPVPPPMAKPGEVPPPKEFIRNVQGSSAGAGSGDFHVYRAHRRREYARQRMLEEKARKDKLTEEYRSKIEAMKQRDEEMTAKKRKKRQRKKQKGKDSKKARPDSDHGHRDCEPLATQGSGEKELDKQENEGGTAGMEGEKDDGAEQRGQETGAGPIHSNQCTAAT